MSEERLQEIKDSVNFQREILLAHNMGTLCVDEEQELIEEIERLKEQLNDEIDDGLKQSEIMVKQHNEIERLNNIIKIMEKYFELIIDLGYDYDGLNQEDSLKKLIDELCRYASLGRVYNITEPIYVNGNKKYNILNEELKGSDKE